MLKYLGGLYNKIEIFSKIKGKFYRVSEYVLLADSQIEDYLNYDEKEIKTSIKESEQNEPNLLLLTYILTYLLENNYDIEKYYKKLFKQEKKDLEKFPINNLIKQI